MRESTLFTDMVTSDLVQMKKSDSFENDCRTFSGTLKPLVAKLQTEVDTIMAQKFARENIGKTGNKRRTP